MTEDPDLFASQLNAEKTNLDFRFFVSSSLRDLSAQETALSLEPLEQDDVVGDGRAGHREA